MQYIIREKTENKFLYNAGSKAREDIDAILLREGAEVIDFIVPFTEKRAAASSLKSLYYHYAVAQEWKKTLRNLKQGDTVYFQFPVKAHTVMMNSVIASLNERGVCTVAFIHDLEYLRNTMYAGTAKKTGWRLKKEEISALKSFSRIIVHNHSMSEFIQKAFAIPEERIIVLEIFDYLIPGFRDTEKSFDWKSVVIAGNMDPDKSGYIYRLPAAVQYELFGANFAGTDSPNVHYNGKFLPDELPMALNGGFGLVWDGERTDTCSGVFGGYLRYNNPHKTSLYLASGLPVIIWSQAALADFVLKNRCGIAVNSLENLNEILNGISEEQYAEMKENAEHVGALLREGYYTKKAVLQCA